MVLNVTLLFFIFSRPHGMDKHWDLRQRRARNLMDRKLMERLDFTENQKKELLQSRRKHQQELRKISKSIIMMRKEVHDAISNEVSDNELEAILNKNDSLNAVIQRIDVDYLKKIIDISNINQKARFSKMMRESFDDGLRRRGHN